jgi:hypothetical protein
LVESESQAAPKAFGNSNVKTLGIPRVESESRLRAAGIVTANDGDAPSPLNRTMSVTPVVNQSVTSPIAAEPNDRSRQEQHERSKDDELF